uniref:receptor-type tyrosine-protein phosphatase O-like isoform X2 n=1 Tax=Myxine glutinosa TaxID=7769 RepID=UPI00358F9DC4
MWLTREGVWPKSFTNRLVRSNIRQAVRNLEFCQGAKDIYLLYQKGTQTNIFLRVGALRDAWKTPNQQFKVGQGIKPRQDCSLNLEDVGKDLPCLAGNQPENKCKNRYFNILPYDSNHVKLLADSPTESDYINASYVKGKSGANHYIATQGPLPCTQAHFWQMVWEQQVSIIIMLTKCKEKLKVKCEPYWPEGKAMEKYGDFVVTLLSEMQQSNWIVRSFIISNVDEGEREVRHFQYMAWPDKGTPINSHMSGLVKFLQQTRLAAQRSNKPILVHCSAGVGRTGTFIALDHVLSDLESGNNNLDFMALVAELRRYRTGMVQTEEQYAFIHTCTLEMWRQLQQTQNDGQKENNLCSNDEMREEGESSNGTEDANDLSVPTIIIHPASEETQLLATNEQTQVGDNPVLLDDDEGENELSTCNNSSQAE